MEDSLNSSVALFAAILHVSTWYLCASGHFVGIRQEMALIGNVRQAASEAKSGPVETGLTGLAATALSLAVYFACSPKKGMDTLSSDYVFIYELTSIHPCWHQTLIARLLINELVC